MDADTDPNRKVALPFGGDAWAQPGSQVAPAASAVKRLRCTGGAVRYRVIGYDGTGPRSQKVDGDLSTADTMVVKIRKDRSGAETLSRTATTVETGGVEVPTGKDLTEDDVSIGDLILIGIASATQDTAAALWVWVDGGATEVGG